MSTRKTVRHLNGLSQLVVGSHSIHVCSTTDGKVNIHYTSGSNKTEFIVTPEDAQSFAGAIIKAAHGEI